MQISNFYSKCIWLYGTILLARLASVWLHLYIVDKNGISDLQCIFQVNSFIFQTMNWVIPRETPRAGNGTIEIVYSGATQEAVGCIWPVCCSLRTPDLKHLLAVFIV